MYSTEDEMLVGSKPLRMHLYNILLCMHLAHMSELYQPVKQNASCLSLDLNIFLNTALHVGYIIIGEYPTSQILCMERIILTF